ncbi:hypothetical protein WJX72_002673 [[Myrmecia] bisecta]|uniref:FAS1 domain-containing protein n=1 Tax=[Myrmecia] bisecta TaxID=41462 RepID=A0AAW1PTA1_9CHLO
MAKTLLASLLVVLVAGPGLIRAQSNCVTVSNLIASSDSLKTLVAAAQAAGLGNALNDANLVGTVFAPSNDAFDNLMTSLGLTSLAPLLADINLLRALLSYHVVPSTAFKVADLANNAALTTLLGENLSVSVGPTGTKIVPTGGPPASITGPDQVACRAIVQVIDTVLLPNSAAAALAALKATPTAPASTNSILAATSTAAVATPVTPVTPATPATPAIPVILTTPTLGYSLLSRALDPAATPAASPAPPVAISGARLLPPTYATPAPSKKGLLAKDPIATAAPVPPTVYKIPSVKTGATPTGYTVVVPATPATTTLTDGNVVLPLGAVPSGAYSPATFKLPGITVADPATPAAAVVPTATVAGLDQALNSSSLVATMFAPTNTAFKAALSALNVTADQLAAQPALITAVLEYHVIPGVAVKTADMTDGEVFITQLPGQSITVKKDDKGAVTVMGASSSSAKVIYGNVPTCNAILHVIDAVLQASTST